MRRRATIGTTLLAAASLGAGALVFGPAVVSAGAAAPAPAQAPAVVSAAAGSLDAYTRDPATKAIYRQVFKAGAWNKPVTIGGRWLYGPGAAVDPDGTTLLAAVAADHKVSIRIRTAGKWSAWSVVDGAVTAGAQPAVASIGKDSFALVVRGRDKKAWVRFITAGKWAEWRSFGTGLTSAPAAVGLPNQSVAVVAARGDGVLWTTTVTSAAAPAPQWTSVGGYTSRTPGFMIDPATGQWEIVATDAAGKVMQRRQADETTWVWEEIAAGAESGVAVTTSGPGEADLLALGSGRALYQASLVRQYYPTGRFPRHWWGAFRPVTPLSTGPGTISRVSVNNAGLEGNAPTIGPVISAKGRYVAFTSGATNMAPGDSTRGVDVYLRDRKLNTVTQVSVSSTGEQGTNASFEPSISGDGRYIAFVSPGSFGPTDDNDVFDDIFVRDMKLGTTTRVSLTPDGKSPNGHSGDPSLSADGRHVVFLSSASNLVAGDVNGKQDVFVRDLVTGETVLASVATDGTQADDHAYGAQGAPHLSADGRYVSFVSRATTLVPADTNGKDDAFVRDLKEKVTTRINVGPDGAQANDGSMTASISDDGQFVAFDSSASNLVEGDTNKTRDIFVRDIAAKTTTRITRADGTQTTAWSWQPAISGDGHSVVFLSRDDALVPGDTNRNEDGFVRDLRTGKTTRINVRNPGLQSDSQASADVGPWQPSLSADGKFAVFGCEADDLVPRDLNRARDIFVYAL